MTKPTIDIYTTSPNWLNECHRALTLGHDVHLHHRGFYLPIHADTVSDWQYPKDSRKLKGFIARQLWRAGNPLPGSKIKKVHD